MYKKIGGDLRYILLNSSNTKFAPAMAAPVVLGNFPTLETRCDVPDIAIKGVELTTELLEGTGVS